MNIYSFTTAWLAFMSAQTEAKAANTCTDLQPGIQVTFPITMTVSDTEAAKIAHLIPGKNYSGKLSFMPDTAIAHHATWQLSYANNGTIYQYKLGVSLVPTTHDRCDLTITKVTPPFSLLPANITVGTAYPAPDTIIDVHCQSTSTTIEGRFPYNISLTTAAPSATSPQPFTTKTPAQKQQDPMVRFISELVLTALLLIACIVMSNMIWGCCPKKKRSQEQPLSDPVEGNNEDQANLLLTEPQQRRFPHGSANRLNAEARRARGHSDDETTKGLESILPSQRRKYPLKQK